MDKPKRKTRLTVPGKDLLNTVKRIAGRGDARSVCLIYEEKRLLDIPLVTGDPAAPATVLAAPVIAAINAFATLAKECTVEVEHIEGNGDKDST